MKIKMNSTRWVVPSGVRLALFKKDEEYEVSAYCGNQLVAYGHAVEIKEKK